MNHSVPVARVLGAALIGALALTACKGRGSNDTLAEGATDRPSESSGATNAGPGAPPVDSAGPGSGDAISQPAGVTSAPGPGPTLMLVSQGAHAPFLGNAAGNALYYVDGDTDGSKCTGPCLQTWPPVTIEAQQPTGAPGLQGAMISTITRAEGSHQVTFNGRPLYRYAADAGAGSANGDGVKDKFGSWHLATPTMAGSTGKAQGAQPSASSAGTAPPKTGG
ncbi:hypothetical protein [Cognatilysobacter lacus]|nr:hypothetical protein [Lysobacter lacus]